MLLWRCDFLQFDPRRAQNLDKLQPLKVADGGKEKAERLSCVQTVFSLVFDLRRISKICTFFYAFYECFMEMTSEEE